MTSYEGDQSAGGGGGVNGVILCPRLYALFTCFIKSNIEMAYCPIKCMNEFNELNAREWN